MTMFQEQLRASTMIRKQRKCLGRRRNFQQNRRRFGKTSLPIPLDTRLVFCCIVAMANILIVTANSRPSPSLHLDDLGYSRTSSSSTDSSSSNTGRQQDRPHSMLRQRRYRQESYKSFLLSRLLEVRAGNSNNGNKGIDSANGRGIGGSGGDTADPTFSDDDLDEYIEFLLAEADGTVDDSANPLFRKEREELQQSWEEDQPIVTPASSTTTIGLDDDPIASATAHASASTTSTTNEESFDESEAQQLDEIIESLVDTVGEGETDQDDITPDTSLDKDAKVDVLVQKLLDNYGDEDAASVDGTTAIPKEDSLPEDNVAALFGGFDHTQRPANT